MIRRFFVQVIESISGSAEADTMDRASVLRLATAVLMVDVARADHEFDESEFESMLRLIETHFGLSAEEAAELVNAAGEEADDMVSVYEFTQLLHQHLEKNEKEEIVGMLWQIAYADGSLDKYENSLVKKISDLLYVSRGRSMRLKHNAATI